MSLSRRKYIQSKLHLLMGQSEQSKIECYRGYDYWARQWSQLL